MIKRNKIRHSEYYDMLDVFDDLYNKSRNGKVFTDLISVITSRSNILLAYRNIKSNSGSHTRGVDGIDITHIKRYSVNKLVQSVQNKFKHYTLTPIKRCEIPKANGKTRNLGIPSIIERIHQQSILQVLEPICEAKFHELSYGFRPVRSTSEALAQCYNAIQNDQLTYVVDIDIKGFFDNVNHSKLIRQLWNMGIRDKKLISIIKLSLKAPIVLPDNTVVKPQNGTQQGGILSPLLANIVLNELDWMINKHLVKPYKDYHMLQRTSKTFNAFHESMPNGIQYVRYADDFKVFCHSQKEAETILKTISKWLKKVLRLDISPEKSGAIDLVHMSSDFLGFSFKAIDRFGIYDIRSHMSEKALGKLAEELTEQLIIILSNPGSDIAKQIKSFTQNAADKLKYYKHATEISEDCNELKRRISKLFDEAIASQNSTNSNKLHSKSDEIINILKAAIQSIENVSYNCPQALNSEFCYHTAKGRRNLHDCLRFGKDTLGVLHALANDLNMDRSIEFFDNRISVYTKQQGKCYVTQDFLDINDVYCHHIIPVDKGGSDNFSNLVIVSLDVHKLIHASGDEIISLPLLNTIKTNKQLKKLNMLRANLGLPKLMLI